MNVLIAEDEPVSRRLLEILLHKWGYQVTVATNGNEAWEALQAKDAPRIAILDWMMPGMDGIEVCQRIKKRNHGSPMYVLLLTAKQEKEDLTDGFQAGADDYLGKPLGAQELHARLRAAGRIIELEDQLLAAQKALNVETTRDPLTGLWNRSLILEILHRELHRARRQRSCLAIVMVDIDHLKEINKHGNLVGDAVLREVSRRMRSSIRLYDSIGRYGGGQFMIVSPSCDEIGAVSQTERLRSRIAQEAVQTFNGPVSVTISLGAAIGADDQQAHLLIAAADAALALAKKNGGNRIQFADD